MQIPPKGARGGGVHEKVHVAIANRARTLLRPGLDPISLWRKRWRRRGRNDRQDPQSPNNRGDSNIPHRRPVHGDARAHPANLSAAPGGGGGRATSRPDGEGLPQDAAGLTDRHQLPVRLHHRRPHPLPQESGPAL